MKLSPQIKDQAGRCVMCGLCLPHCPTYVKTQNEGESPRGRISLILGLAGGQLEPDEKLRAHLDNCLLCRACEAKCPSGVRFGEIMDGARQALAVDQPSREQAINLERLATDKKQQRREATLLWLSDKTGLRTLGRGLGVTKAVGLERFEQLAPRIKRPHAWRNYYPAKGEQRGEIALFTGCFSDMFDQTTLDSAVTLLTACGYGVHIPAAQTCCGALHQHKGDTDTAKKLTGQNLAAFEALKVDTVISCASGCGSQLSEYQRLIGKTVNAVDISTFLQQIEWPEALRLKPLPKKVAVHEPCSLRTVLKQSDAPYSLLKHIPELHVIPLPGNEQCCGAAGSYMIEHPEMADRLRADKLAAIHATRPDLLVTSNIGCALHIAAGLKKHNPNLEVIHPVTLLARQLVA